MKITKDMRGLASLMMVVSIGISGCQSRGEESSKLESDQAISDVHAKNVVALGKNIFEVWPGAEMPSFGQPTPETLTPKDVDAIARQCPAVVACAPVVKLWGVIEFKDRNWAPQNIVGTSEPYLAIRDWQEFKEGVCFTDREVRDGAKVCVLGQTAAKGLFKNASPLGQEIQIKGQAFRVIGILDEKSCEEFG